MEIFILTGRTLVDDEGTWSNISVHATRQQAVDAQASHKAQAIADYGIDGPDDEDYEIEEHDLQM